MSLAQERMWRTNFDEKVVGETSEESVGEERDNCSYGRHVQNSDTVYRRVGHVIKSPQECSETKHTSDAAPQVLYSYYGALARRSIECKAMAYRQ
jgi:hypothetical protein